MRMINEPSDSESVIKAFEDLKAKKELLIKEQENLKFKKRAGYALLSIGAVAAAGSIFTILSINIFSLSLPVSGTALCSIFIGGLLTSFGAGFHISLTDLARTKNSSEIETIEKQITSLDTAAYPSSTAALLTPLLNMDPPPYAESTIAVELLAPATLELPPDIDESNTKAEQISPQM